MKRIFAVLAVAVLWGIPGHAAVTCKVQDLGARNIAYDISSLGVAGCTTFSDWTTDATVWFNGKTVRYGKALPGQSQAFGINNAGQTVGYTALPDGRFAAFLNIGNKPEKTLVLPELEMAYGIDDDMNIFGFYYTEDGYLAAACIEWGAGTFFTLEPLAGFTSSVAVHGNSEQAVGYSMTDYGDVHATLWDWRTGEAIDLHPPGAAASWANAINSFGDVVVEAEYPHPASGWDVIVRSFVWGPDGVAVEIIAPVSGYTVASDINDLGQVVGSYRKNSNGDHQAFIWDGACQNLVASGWVLSEAYGINNLGQVCGVGYYRKTGHAFKATPIRR